MVVTLSRLFVLFCVFSGFSLAFSAEKPYNSTYRGPTGRVIGRAYQNGNQTSYFSNSGRKLGYSIPNNRSGSQSFYGSSGRYQGSAPLFPKQPGYFPNGSN